MTQIKGQFGKVELGKVGRGALIAATGALALYLLDWAGTLEVGTMTPIIAALVPILVNIVKEWLKGN